jgi:hypothetical protein
LSEAGMLDWTTVGRARGGAQTGESEHKEKMAQGSAQALEKARFGQGNQS